jgi:hypothetical protein
MKKYEKLGMTKDAYKEMRLEESKIGNWQYAIKQAKKRIAEHYAKIEIERAKIAVWEKKIADAN